MNPTPRDELREYLSLKARKQVDQQQVMRRKRQIVDDFRRQLAFGAPKNEDEQGLRDLVRQLRSGKVTVKLFLRYSLHAKLYLIHKQRLQHAHLGFSRQQQSHAGWPVQARRAEYRSQRLRRLPKAERRGSKSAGTIRGASISPKT